MHILLFDLWFHHLIIQSNSFIFLLNSFIAMPNFDFDAKTYRSNSYMQRFCFKGSPAATCGVSFSFIKSTNLFALVSLYYDCSKISQPHTSVNCLLKRRKSVHDHGRSPNVENRAKDYYLAVIANMPFYLFSQTKNYNRVTLHWTAYRASSR